MDFSPNLFSSIQPLQQELLSLSLSKEDLLKRNIELLKCNKQVAKAYNSVCPTFPFPVDTQFRMSILERLEQMEQRMAEITNQNPSSETMATKGGGVEGGGASDQQSQVRRDEGGFSM